MCVVAKGNAFGFAWGDQLGECGIFVRELPLNLEFDSEGTVSVELLD